MSTLSPFEEALLLEQTYPSSDGQPMAETPAHANAMVLLHQGLQDWFRTRPDVFVGIDMFWYFKEGDPGSRCAPDVMVIPGVTQRYRRSYFSWRENGAIPTVVFEMVSEGNWKEDLFAKHFLYEELGVKEYFLFDPENDHLRPLFQGFHLRGSAYRRIMPEPDGSLFSKELGLLLRMEEGMLRLINRETGVPVLTREEQAREAEQRAEQEQKRAQQAEQRAEQERQLAQQAEQRAQQAENAVANLQAELARLRALLPPQTGESLPSA